MGDLNAGPENKAVLRLLKSDTGLRDSYHIADPLQKRVGTFHGFRGGADGASIDWVLATPQWMVESAGVVTEPIDGRYPSDHFPVWAVVALPGE